MYLTCKRDYISGLELQSNIYFSEEFLIYVHTLLRFVLWNAGLTVNSYHRVVFCQDGLNFEIRHSVVFTFQIQNTIATSLQSADTEFAIALLLYFMMTDNFSSEYYLFKVSWNSVHTFLLYFSSDLESDRCLAVLI